MTRSHTRKGPNVTRGSVLQLLGGGPAGLVSGYEHGSKIHPQYEEEFENGVAVAWQNMPFMQGGWAIYSQETRDQYYEQLFEPDGRVYLAGEHMSYLTGWQEGAVQAAWLQMQALHQRVAQESG